jgi:hypothetical protein
MKKTLLTLAFALLATVASNAQGTINFVNTTLSRVTWESAPGSGAFANVAVGAPIVYGVFWGTTADNMQLNTGPLGTASTANAGLIAAANPYVIVGTSDVGGETYFMKVGGWSSAFGRDFAAAKAAQSPSLTDLRYYGETGVRSITTGPGSGPATVIWSGSNQLLFQPLKLNALPVVPEPSVIALGALGIGAFLLRFRKKA